MSTHARFLCTAIALLALLLAGCPADDTEITGSTEEAVADGHEGHDHAAHAEGHHDSPFHAEGVTTALENIENGATLSYTTENAELVTELQEFAAKKAEGGHDGCKGDCPCKWDGVSKSIENLDDGVKVTMTAEDAELVGKLQEALAAKVESGCGCGKHGEAKADEEEGCTHGKGHDAHADKPWSILHSSSVTRATENLDNGVKVMFTAGCPHKQGLLQEAGPALVEHLASDEAVAAHADSPFHLEGVTATAETIDGGVAVSFVSEDAEVVTRLQEHAAMKAEDEAADEGCGGCKDEHPAHEA